MFKTLNLARLWLNKRRLHWGGGGGGGGQYLRFLVFQMKTVKVIKPISYLIMPSKFSFKNFKPSLVLSGNLIRARVKPYSA